MSALAGQVAYYVDRMPEAEDRYELYMKVGAAVGQSAGNDPPPLFLFSLL